MFCKVEDRDNWKGKEESERGKKKKDGNQSNQVQIEAVE